MSDWDAHFNDSRRERACSRRLCHRRGLVAERARCLPSRAGFLECLQVQILIKQYNGTGIAGEPGVGNYIAWDNLTDPLNPNWVFNRSDGQTPPHNYVGLVCSQTP